MIGLTQVYALAGFVFAGFAVLSLRDPTNPRRVRNALFWGLFALSFLAGDRLGDLGNGVLVPLFKGGNMLFGLNPQNMWRGALIGAAFGIGVALFMRVLKGR
jgi:uncharacterized membrane protein